MSEMSYALVVGSLMYAMVCRRPDIAQAVGIVTRYMSNPKKEHWRAVKWSSELGVEAAKGVALSITEAKYVAATEACKELIWLNVASVINFANNPVYHDRTKHIDVRYHFIRILLKDVLSLMKIHTSRNSADMLTKIVTTEKLKTCSASVGLLGWRSGLES